MKKTLIILSLILTLSSCNKGIKIIELENDNTETTDINQLEPGTIQLTKAEFLTRVIDFETNPNSFEYLGDKPAIIDFYADWCAPCKTIAPILEELAEEYHGKIYIYKIDVGDEEEIPIAFGVRNIPTLLFIPVNGQIEKIVGASTKENFKSMIDETLLKK